jgi:hypothetical protein
MLSYLRHISIRIWIAVLLGGLVSLLVLPMSQSRFGLESNIIVAGAALLFFYGVTGWVLNRWALNNANYLMAEAGVFERDGMYREAENAFRKAVAIFDSFMISPVVKRKKANELGARLARFYLARNRRDHLSQDFLISYLNANPLDGHVAEYWLHQLESGGGLKEKHQDTAARIGDAQPDNQYIQSTLARFYLLLERTDFSALQTYRRVCRNKEPLTAEFIDELAGLFVKEKRADEWALEIYLRALANNSERKDCLRGLAACIRWTPATERNQRLLQSARQYLKGFDENSLKKMQAGFSPPVPAKPSRKAKNRIQASVLLTQTARFLYHFPFSIVRWIIGRVREAVKVIQRSRRVRRALSALLLVGLALGVGALVVNTVRHLTPQEAPAEKAVTQPVEVISDPFTLQVAAYLKPEYARNFVQQLKKRGVDAYWSEAVRGEKKWYQVRVSHFATKQDARDYGEKLKAQDIIEDFYVANYKRP